MAPTTVDGLDVDDVTIDGEVVDEITLDGDVVYQASAILDSVVDNFEDHPDGPYDDGETLSDFYTGDGLDEADRQTSVVSPADGSTHALQVLKQSGSPAMVSTSGLPRYPEQGEIFECWMRGETSDEQPAFAFGVQGTDIDDDSYRVQIDRIQDNSISLIKSDGGDTTTLDDTGVSTSTGTWYRFEVEWYTDGDIDVTMFDDDENSLATLTANDTAFSAGGIGFRPGSFQPGDNGLMWWDNYVVIGSL